MTAYENYANTTRMVGLTICSEGHNDLYPENLLPAARWWERVEDFYRGSYKCYSMLGKFTPAWCPAYVIADSENREVYRADVMVFDLHGCSAHHVLKWLSDNDLAGIVHPTKSDSLTTPRSRLILLLHRQVSFRTYKSLWRRIARDVFANIPPAAHADFRQRYDQPNSSVEEPTLMGHDGNPLYVDGALSLDALDGTALGTASAVHANEVNEAYIRFGD